MKFILLFLISLNCFAAYVPKDQIGISDVVKTFTRAQSCASHYGKECMKIPFGYNKDIYSVVPEQNLKMDVEACADEADCNAKHTAKECTEPDYSPIMNLELMESYCWKRIKEHVGVDAAKKAAYDAKAAKKAARAAKKARGAESRQKCKDALDYVAGGNLDSEMTEEQIDAMMASFAPILQALQNNRPGKAARLIKLVTDPMYDQLKEDVLEILEK